MLYALPIAAMAQHNLHVEKIFEKYRNNSKAVEVMVGGEVLEDYGLWLFHSLTIKAPKEELLSLEQYVLQDASNAINKETGRLGRNLYYGFYQLPEQTKGMNRFLIFRNRSLKGKHLDATIIYLEGKASMNEIKRKFK